MLLEDDLKRIKDDLAAYDSAREDLFDVSRRIIRLASWTILQIHRRQLQEAEENLKKIKETIHEMEDSVKKVPEIAYHPNALTAYQEYVEAKSLYTLISEGRLCTLDEVQVSSTQYLLGLLDLVGELRRASLEHLKSGDPKSAEEKLTMMEQIYETLLSLDHTSAISNFRHKMDSTRRIIEVTRGDVVSELRRWSLEKAINELNQSIQNLERMDTRSEDFLKGEGDESSRADG